MFSLILYDEKTIIINITICVGYVPLPEHGHPVKLEKFFFVFYDTKFLKTFLYCLNF